MVGRAIHSAASGYVEVRAECEGLLAPSRSASGNSMGCDEPREHSPECWGDAPRPTQETPIPNFVLAGEPPFLSPSSTDRRFLHFTPWAYPNDPPFHTQRIAFGGTKQIPAGFRFSNFLSNCWMRVHTCIRVPSSVSKPVSLAPVRLEPDTREHSAFISWFSGNVYTHMVRLMVCVRCCPEFICHPTVSIFVPRVCDTPPVARAVVPPPSPGAGDYTRQKFLGSMEGAVLSGKLAARVVCRTGSFGRPGNLRDRRGGVRERQYTPQRPPPSMP